MKNISSLYEFSLKAEGGTNSVNRSPLRRSCVSSARNAGESAICSARGQPSAEIARVECAERRRECDLSVARATLCGDRACRVREMQARARSFRCPRNPLRRSCVSSARNAGERAICPVPARPSAEIARVECAKCRRECDLSGARATLMRRSCVSSARNAGESAICPVLAQPSAEIVRVECAKCSRQGDVSHVRVCLGSSKMRDWQLASTTVVRGVAGSWKMRLCSKTLVRGVSGELEDENWGLGSTTFIRGVSENWKMRTGDSVVKL